MTTLTAFDLLTRFSELNHELILRTLLGRDLRLINDAMEDLYDRGHDLFKAQAPKTEAPKTEAPKTVSPIVPLWVTEVQGFLAVGDRAGAIKRVRTDFDLSLYDAKAVIDSIQDSCRLELTHNASVLVDQYRAALGFRFEPTKHAYVVVRRSGIEHRAYSQHKDAIKARDDGTDAFSSLHEVEIT